MSTAPKTINIGDIINVGDYFQAISSVSYTWDSVNLKNLYTITTVTGTVIYTDDNRLDMSEVDVNGIQKWIAG